MAGQRVTPQSEDYARWYTDVVRMAELADYAPVRGCMIIRPYGYELWEAVKAGLDRRFRETGHQNAYFPLLIPMSFIEREAEHVEGFAPELAVVTHAGGKELDEPLVVRPTSETIIGHAFSEWIQSHRDLPLLINQWANVVRWEMRPRLFLRTTEFLWQEGHTAHATADEAIEETLSILDIYADFSVRDAAIPVIKGKKSAQEKFAGATESYTIEAMMRNAWALQSGTSHFLGQNFARVFDITYTDEDNQLQHCWTTSWGVSSRMVGGIVMAHGDDRGLRLPPAVAPHQVVIVPIWRNDEDRGTVLDAAQSLEQQLIAGRLRVHLDEREGLTPGYKFNDWEMRGVPLRVEIGPRDVAAGTVVFVRRDQEGKAGKSVVDAAGACQEAHRVLESIQETLLEDATAFRDARLHDARSLDELREIVAEGWALLPHCGTPACEAAIKEQTKATSRCFPLDRNSEWNPRGVSCAVCGKPALGYAYFARSY